MRVIDVRAQLLELDDLITGDRYIFTREAYLQRRQFLIEDGEGEDPFLDDLESGAGRGAQSRQARLSRNTSGDRSRSWLSW
jgi:ABC-type transporter lipoprotein component MlaA